MLRKHWQWLTTRDESQLKPWDVILWWERRRIPYNLIVGSAGIISVVIMYLFMAACREPKPGEDAVEPMALIGAPFLINFCYTAGWFAELILGVKRHNNKLGPLLFTIGTAFSILVVFIPSLIWGVIWFLTRIAGVK